MDPERWSSYAQRKTTELRLVSWLSESAFLSATTDPGERETIVLFAHMDVDCELFEPQKNEDRDEEQGTSVHLIFRWTATRSQP